MTLRSAVVRAVLPASSGKGFLEKTWGPSGTISPQATCSREGSLRPPLHRDRVTAGHLECRHR